MSKVKYNGITLENVLVEGVTMHPIYEKGDPIATMFEFSCRSVVWTTDVGGEGTVEIGATSSDANIETCHSDIIEKLSSPRRDFEWYIGGELVKKIYPTMDDCGKATSPKRDGTIDVENGPRPEVEILKVIGRDCFHIRFTIRATVQICGCPSKGADDRIQYIKWSHADQYSTDWMLRRTYTGTLRVTGRNISPHIFQALVLPPLQAGFVRESVNLKESEDHMSLDFSVTDQEVYETAPAKFVSSWSGNQTVSFPNPGGNIGYTDFDLELKGNRHRPPRYLFAAAWNIIQNRLSPTFNNESASFLQSFSARHMFTKNIVNVSIRVMHSSGYNDPNSAIQSWGRRISERGGYYDKDPNPTIPNTFLPSSSLSGIFHQALANQCGFTYTHTGSGNVSDVPWSVEYGQGTSSPPDTDGSYRQDVKDTNVTVYNIKNHWKKETGNKVYPSSPYHPRDEGYGDNYGQVSVHPSFLTRQIEIHAESINGWAAIPNDKNFKSIYDGVELNHVCRKWELIAPSVEYSADGVSTYHKFRWIGDYAIDSNRSGSIPIALGRAFFTENSDPDTLGIPRQNFINIGDVDHLQ